MHRPLIEPPEPEIKKIKEVSEEESRALLAAIVLSAACALNVWMAFVGHDTPSWPSLIAALVAALTAGLWWHLWFMRRKERIDRS